MVSGEAEEGGKICSMHASFCEAPHACREKGTVTLTCATVFTQCLDTISCLFRSHDDNGATDSYALMKDIVKHVGNTFSMHIQYFSKYRCVCWCVLVCNSMGGIKCVEWCQCNVCVDRQCGHCSEAALLCNSGNTEATVTELCHKGCLCWFQ